MANQTLVRLLVIWRNLVFFHDFLDNIQNYRIFFDTQQAILRFHNMVGASRVKSGNDSSILIASKRKLCLVAVAPRVLHPQDRLHGDSFIHTFPGTFPLTRSLLSPPHRLSPSFRMYFFQIHSQAHSLHLPAPAAADSPSRRSGAGYCRPCAP